MQVLTKCPLRDAKCKGEFSVSGSVLFTNASLDLKKRT